MFNQVAREHLRNGCPECGNENKGRYTESYFINNPEKKNISCKLYSLKFTHKESSETFYKVGVTINSIKKRFKLDNVRYDIEILDIEQDTLWNCFKKEKQLLKETTNYKYTPKIKLRSHGNIEIRSKRIYLK